MNLDDVEDLCDAIDFSTRRDKAAEFEREARALAPGELGQALLLISAVEHLQMQGELDRAWALLDTVGTPHPGELGAGVAAHRLSLALDLGRTELAESLLRDLLAAFRRDELTVADCQFIGEALEEAGDLTRAQRWFTLPLSGTDPVLDPDLVDEPSLVGRYRVRRRLGLGTDLYDQLFEETHG